MQTHVYVVVHPHSDDGLYVFTEEEDALAFIDAGSREDAYMSIEPVLNMGQASELIRTERESHDDDTDDEEE